MKVVVAITITDLFAITITRLELPISRSHSEVMKTIFMMLSFSLLLVPFRFSDVVVSVRARE
jgi:hypothetical protein